MTTLTIRIDEKLKVSASKVAEKLGVSLSFVIKNALKNFIETPKIVISESKSIEVTPEIQKKMDQVAKQLKNK